MKRRLLLGLIPFLLLVLVAVAGVFYVTSSQQVGHASTCKASPLAQADITITDKGITSGYPILTPGVCYHFVITNTSHSTYDVIVSTHMMGAFVRSNLTTLAQVSALAPGKSESFDYAFAQAHSGTVMQFSCFLPTHEHPSLSAIVTLAK